MAVKLPLGITKTQICFFISLLLNLLGGTGTIQPLLGAPDPECPVASPALSPAPPAPAPIEPARN